MITDAPSPASFSALDHAHMAEALRLAERGAWTTRPNPMVGCVIAAGERVLGRGWHRRAGGPHAEVFALAEAGEAARGATAYVTLEPCAHHGRTPPCAEGLIAAGVARVVCALADPFHAVDGRGVERLRAAGIVVDCGLCETEARALNRGFLSRVERGRPWLRIKLAMSLDGRTALASGESKWITGAAARADVQRWRARAGAILTGSGTLRADDPRLTARVDGDLEPPLRVVVSRQAELAADAALLTEPGPVLLAHGEDIRPLPLPGVDTLALPLAGDGVDLPALLRALGGRGINEVQVEAGPLLCGALLAAGLVDELLVYQAPILLGERGRPLLAGIDPVDMQARIGLRRVDARQVGDDLRLLLIPIEI
jgi:diaminohydroxyphosphoribosylaminopyrimidine deaminase / 5-amino-6-(5-phosphoribosylamino)uracil reductase